MSNIELLTEELIETMDFLQSIGILSVSAITPVNN